MIGGRAISGCGTMTIGEYIKELEKIREDHGELEVVILSEINGQFHRVRSEPRHIRVLNAGKRGVEAVKGVWSPLHRVEEKGEKVLILW